MTHEELEIERFTSLIETFCGQMIKSVEAATGDADYLESWAEKMIDDMKLCFKDAAEKREDRRMNPSEPAREFAA